jgi:putative hydrolase of the HAD superfamily
MDRPLAIFDGDDTLWFVEPLYDKARSQAGRLVAAAGLDPLTWEVVEREIDVRNVEILGVSPARFPTSCVEAYRQLAEQSDRHPDPSVEERIRGAAEQVFRWAATPADGIPGILDELRFHFTLVLLTKGDPVVQRKRVDDSGVASKFDEIRICPEKSERQFRDVLADHDAEPTSAWSIGNSLASDVNPALRIGMRAIWVDAHVWEYERRELDPVHESLISAPNLSVAVDVLLKMVAGSGSSWNHVS